MSFPLCIVMPGYLGPFSNPFGEVRAHGREKALRMLASLMFQDCDVFVMADGCSATVAAVDEARVLYERSGTQQRLRSGYHETTNTADDEGVRHLTDYGSGALNVILETLNDEPAAERYAWVGYASLDDWVRPGFYALVQERLAAVPADVAWVWTQTGRRQPASRMHGGQYQVTGVDIYHRLPIDARYNTPAPDGSGYGHDHSFAEALHEIHGPGLEIDLRDSELADGYVVGHVPRAFDR